MKRACLIFIIFFLGPISAAYAAPLGSAGSGNPSEMAYFWYNTPNSNPPQIFFRDYLSISPWDQNIPNSKTTVFPPCNSSNVLPCIEAVEGRIKSEGVWRKFTPGKELHAKLYSDSSNERRIAPFAANFPRLWLAPDNLATQAGLNYLVSAYRNETGLHFGINPIQVGQVYSTQYGCPWAYVEILCPRLFNHPLDSEFRISIRMGEELRNISSWMYARSSDPSIRVESSLTGKILQLTGSPMLVPTAHAPMSRDQLLGIFPGLNPATFGVFPATGMSMLIDSWGIDLFKKSLPYISDNSIGENVAWHFDSGFAYGNKCFQNLDLGLGGIVVSNASSFSSSPPTWNETETSLDYEVGAPHYLSTGQINEGEYRILIQTGIAKCLWGAEVLDGHASISIIDDAGVSQHVTSTFKVKDDFLYLSIAGFHYSASKIKVVVEAPKSVKASELPPIVETSTTIVGLPTIPKTTKKTATCVKGKSKRTIVSAALKCPKGYSIKK